MTTDKTASPLEIHERELANIVRALPHHEPPCVLDQKILASAHKAVEMQNTDAPTRKPLRWLHWGWGTGVAATAVLAAGISWHLRPVVQPPSIDSNGQSSAVLPTTKPADRFEVEFGEGSVPPASVSIPPPPPEAPAMQQQSAPAAPAIAEKRMRADQPAANRAEHEKLSRRQDHAMEPAESPINDQNAMTDSAVALPSTSLSKQKAEETIAQLSQRKRQQRDVLDVLPESMDRIRDDARLPIQQWLDKIRQRRDSGDLEGAKASLLLFQRRHPKMHLPRDLLVL